MWIVRVALRRPYTFVVLALLIVILSPVVILRTPTDIFPNVDIPVIAVAFSYTGLNPEEMEGRITTVFERVVTTVVNDVEHIESTTINGQAIVRIFLQPGANVDRATAQITAGSQTILRFLPPGTQPPLMVNYSASTVPILQLALKDRPRHRGFDGQRMVVIHERDIPLPLAIYLRQKIRRQRLRALPVSSRLPTGYWPSQKGCEKSL